MTSTDIEMPLVAQTPPPPSEPPRQENRAQFRFRAPPPEKKPAVPLEEVSLKPIALHFLKLRKNVHNLLQTCSEDSVNGEMVETITELKDTLKGFKTEFKKLPKLNDIRDEQQHRIAELLKQIQMKDEFLVKLIGPSLIKTEVEDVLVPSEEKPQTSEETTKDKVKKKEKKDKTETKNKSDSKVKSKNKSKDKVKSEKKKEKTAEKPETSEKPKSTKTPKESKEVKSKKIKSKIAENVPISKSKKKPPIERRLVDPAKIKKLKEKIAEDKRKRAEFSNAATKIISGIVPKPKSISAAPKSPAKGTKEQKQKVVKLQKQPSTTSLKLPQPLDAPQTSQQKDQPSKDHSQKEKSLQNQPSKDDVIQKEGDNKDTKNDKEQPANNEAVEEMEIQYPAEPPSPPIVKIMPLPGKKLRKPEPPIKTVVTFGRAKPMEKKEPPKNPEEPLKSALKKPEGTEEEPKQVEENKNGEEQEKKVEEEKVEKAEDDKPATWKDLRQMFKKEKIGKNDKPDDVKTSGSSTKTSKKNSKLSKQYKLRKALKKLAKIQARHEKRKEDQKKKVEEKKKTEPTERMNIFKYYEDEKAKKKASRMASLNASKKSRIVKKVIRKPISRNEQILRKIRRNAINNAQRDGYYTSPLLTIKYITELQNMIESAEKDGEPLSSEDFRRLRFKYFPCKDSELYTEKLKHGDKRPPMSKHEIEQLRKTNFVNIQSDINQQNSNITYQRNIPRTVTDVSMRLPRKEFDEEQLDQSLFDELTKMGF